MKSLKLQVTFAIIFTMASFILTCLMFVYMYEYQGCVERTHVIFGCALALCNMISTRLLIQVCQEYQEAKDEYAQHMLDVADDYASREY